MEQNKNAIACAPSTYRPNVFFFFRDNGTEIEFEISDNKSFSRFELTEEEKDYIQNNLIKQSFESKINNQKK